MIVRRALEEPIRQIVENAGAEGSVNNNYLIDTPGRVIHHLRDAGGFPRAAVPTMVSGVGRQRLWDCGEPPPPAG